MSSRPTACRVACSIFVTILLMSCAAKSPVELEQELRPNWISLQKVNSWDMRGRIAFRLGKEGWHGKIDWASHSPQERIRISGPIGQGAVVILVEGETVKVQHSDGRIEVANNSATLLKRQLGFSVPISALRWWVRGLPVADEQFEILKNSGDSIVFRQGGWVISQRDFRLYDAEVLPRRLTLESGEVSLKFVIDRWRQGGINEQ